jgi:UDP-glucose 4-epimerase
MKMLWQCPEFDTPAQSDSQNTKPQREEIMIDIRDSHALVTGGAGFIGSHIADRLIKEGAKVRILDNLSTGNISNVNLELTEFIQGDLADDEVLRKALDGVDIVFHEAAQINPARAVEEPLFDFKVNAEGTLKLILHSLRANVKRFIMACTNTYGDAEVGEMSEDLSTLAVKRSLLSPYAASKVCAEAYLKVANDELGLPTVRLRYFNVFGPRQLPKSECGVIAIFVQNALAGKPLYIFGDGTYTRDFVYVDDVVDANLLAAKNENVCGAVFNVGTGIETSVNELAERIKQITNSKVPIIHTDSRAADCRRSKADLTQSRRILGFEPKVGFEEGLRRYVQWYQFADQIMPGKPTKCIRGSLSSDQSAFNIRDQAGIHQRFS